MTAKGRVTAGERLGGPTPASLAVTETGSDQGQHTFSPGEYSQ